MINAELSSSVLITLVKQPSYVSFLIKETMYYNPPLMLIDRLHLGEVEPTVPSKWFNKFKVMQFRNRVSHFFIWRHWLHNFISKSLCLSPKSILIIFTKLNSCWIQRRNSDILKYKTTSMGPRGSNRVEAVLALLLSRHECGSLRDRLCRPGKAWSSEAGARVNAPGRRVERSACSYFGQ